MFALTPQRSNRLWLWGGLAIIVLAEVCLSPWLRIFPNGIVEDDGYFYAKIAMNIGASGRSTFDGIHSTSGYHLAWGGILGATSAVLRIFTTNPWIHLSVFHTIGLAAIFLHAWIGPTTANALAPAFASSFSRSHSFESTAQHFSFCQPLTSHCEQIPKRR